MLQTTSPVERRQSLSRDEFVRAYLRPRNPVVITDAARAWKARATFTPEFFQREFGDKPLTVAGKKYSMRGFIDLLLSSDERNPAPYPCNIDLHKHFPELLPYVDPPLDLALPDRLGSRLLHRRLLRGCNTLELFLGGPGGRFPYLHYDYLHLHACITQLYGEKEFTVYPPHQRKYLYVDPQARWRSSIENHHDPDLARYPLYSQATPTRFVLRAGETLFIPCGWWHTARSLTVSVSVAFDMLDGSNWWNFVADNVWLSRRKPLQALAVGAWLSAAGLALAGMESLARLKKIRVLHG